MKNSHSKRIRLYNGIYLAPSEDLTRYSNNNLLGHPFTKPEMLINQNQVPDADLIQTFRSLHISLKSEKKKLSFWITWKPFPQTNNLFFRAQINAY